MNDLLLPPAEWERLTGIVVLDADGWGRCGTLGPKGWDEPISRSEFHRRVSYSTIEQKVAED